MEHGRINIKNCLIDREMKDSYLEYAMSVIVSRALPDVRDGLKPVHRRIIYDMHRLGLTPDKPYRKSAKVVGDVLSNFHPHSDSSVYDTMVRMAQDFNTRYPLVDGQGNFGSIDGDGAAAMRYTEAKMTRLTLELLRDINKETVDFRPNYDDQDREPVVLPARFPNLLVNGSAGIAVGMATNIPPHNLKEVIEAILQMIDRPDISQEELEKLIPGPDFPTGAVIRGREGIRRAYRTGRGKILLQAVATIDEIDGRSAIIVTEIPYQVNKAKLVMKIASLVKEKKVEGIFALRDESNREGIRIVIELKRDANPNVILNLLYKYTPMQTTFGIINLALVGGEPKVLSLKELLKHYIEHQRDVVTRRTRFDLSKMEARAHIVEGLLKALDHIDEIIRIIRNAYSDALERLMEAFGFSEIQAQSILDMRLKRLQGLEKEKLTEEYKELTREIERLREILADEGLLFGIIKEELREIQEKYGDARRTQIENAMDDMDLEDYIDEEEVLITLTHSGYIKRQPEDNYRVQNRGGKGISGLTMKEDDFVDTLFVTSTHDTILFFTSFGKVLSLKGYEIPLGSRQAKGQAIINLLELEPNERISAVIPLGEKKEETSLVMLTKRGIIKRTASEAFESIRKNGIIAITLDEDDELLSVRQAGEYDEAVLVTREGLSLRMRLSDVRQTGRSSRGVKALELRSGDELVSMDIVTDPSDSLLVVSEFGYGKKTELSHYRTQNRGGRGLLTYRISEKTGPILSARIVGEKDEVILASLKGDLIRLKVSDISTKGRATMGVKIKDVDPSQDRIVAVTKVLESSETESLLSEEDDENIIEADSSRTTNEERKNEDEA